MQSVRHDRYILPSTSIENDNGVHVGTVKISVVRH